MATLNEVLAQIEELKTIKSDLKEAIAAQGGEINDETLFAHYPYIINNLDTGYRFGLSMDDLIGDVDENGVLQAPQEKELNVVFNLLERIAGDENNSAIRLCTAPNSIKTVSFPDLVEVSSYQSLSYALYGCTALTSVDLSSLTVIGHGGLNSTFENCVSLTSVDLSSLTEIGSLGLFWTFRDCVSLTSVSFPSLTSLQTDSCIGTFLNCTNLTEIHFRSNMQAIIEATSSYSNKWGATNATFYFDL